MLIEFVKFSFMKVKKKEIEISDERKTFDLLPAAKTILPLVKKVLGQKGLVAIDLIQEWEQIVGEELAEFTIPWKIDFKKNERNNGVLSVYVPSGAFALELQHRESFILNKINMYFGYQAVSSLKIIQNSSFDVVKENKIGCERKQKALVSPQEENYIKELAEGVENSALKQKLEELGRSVFSENKGVKKEK